MRRDRFPIFATGDKNCNLESGVELAANIYMAKGEFIAKKVAKVRQYFLPITAE